VSKPERTCLACFEQRPASAFASPRARKCDRCYVETEQRQAQRTRVCVRCEEPRPLSEYAPHGRCCAACSDKPPLGRPRTCLRCGVVKEADAFAWGDGTKGRGVSRRRKGSCLECEAATRAAKELAAKERAAKRSSWEQDGVMMRRCSRCTAVKPLETGFYVDEPAAKGMKRWRYWCKTCDAKRSTEYKRRRFTGPEMRAKYAAWNREWRKRNPERYKAALKRYADKVKADPQRHAAHLENCRIAYRLRQESRGRSLDSIRKQRAHLPLPADTFGRLPALPIVRALESYARREAVDEASVCEFVGIDPRNLFAWRMGERQLVQFDVADRVLTGLGLSWWDVWDENDPAVRAVWERQVAA